MNRLLMSIFIIAVGGLFFPVFYVTGMNYSDDFCMQCYASHNIRELIANTIEWINTTNGRWMSFILWSKLMRLEHLNLIWALIQTFMWIISVLLLYRIINRRWAKYTYDIPGFAFFILMSWFFNKGNGEVLFWITGSIPYLWGWVLGMAYLMPFILFYEKGRETDQKRNVPRQLAVCSLMLITGWIMSGFFEVVDFLILAVIFMIFIHKYMEDKNLFFRNWWPYYVGVLGLIAGFFIIITSKGHAVRSMSAHAGFGQILISLPALIFKFKLPLIFWAIFCILIMAKKRLSLSGFMQKHILSVIALFLALIGLVPPAYGGVTDLRSLYIPSSLIFMGILPMAREILPDIRRMWIVFLPAGGLFIYTIYGIFQEQMKYNHSKVQRELYINSSLRKGIVDVKVTPLYQCFSDSHGEMKRFMYHNVMQVDVTPDNSLWINICAAKAYGLKSITLKEK